MRLTNREKLLIAVLLVAGILSATVYFLYLPVYDNLQFEKQELKSNESILANIERNILPLDQQMQLINSFKQKVEIMQRTLPPVIYQESIMVELKNVFSKNGLLVQSYDFGKGEKKEKIDTDQIAIDQILAGYEDTILDNLSKDMVEARFEAASVDKGNNSEESIAGWKEVVDVIDVTVSLEGEYENIKQAISEIESLDNLVVVNSLAVAKDTRFKNRVIGSLELKFPYYYDNEILERVDWEYLSAHVQHRPFDYVIIGSEADSNRPISISNESNLNDFTNLLQSNSDNLGGLYDRQAENNAKLNSDFELILSAPTSILNPYFISKSDQRDFSLTSIRSSETLSLTVIESQGTYSYQYSHSRNGFPRAGEYMSFNPNYKDGIYVNVVSSPRIDEKDVGIGTFNVYNKTSLPVKIVVNTDDDKLPRFNMGEQEGNVTVIRN